MASMGKRIAVIGAGISGLTSIVSLKEVGCEPVCFEYADKPGGTWYYQNTSVEGMASIMPTTIINHSKELGAFSNFPPQKERSNYMRHIELYEYVMEYAAEKDALRHIRCNSEVIEVKRSDDYKETGRWSVSVKNRLTGAVTTGDIFDGVLVCVGHMNRPIMPIYPDQEKFEGKIMHTHTLKEVDEFRNTNVVVVGMGCSGLDAAEEISRVSKQVYLSTRSGAHVIPRVGNRGYPMDISVNRYTAVLTKWSWPIVSWFLEVLYLDARFDPSLYSVPPNHRVLSKDPAFNDNIDSKILSGSVIQKRGIERFTEKGVIFQGDSEETLADVVMMATGYTWKFPFLENGVINQEDGMINLYRCIFPPQLPHATLGIIGFVISWGPGFPVLEMQSRYAASIISGRHILPTPEVMYKDIRQRQERNLNRFGQNEKTSVRVDFINYLDDLASVIGVKPNFLNMFFTDIRLFMTLWFGHFVSYQYRLQGLNAWKEARDTIMTSEQRIVYPIKKSNLPSTENFFLSFFKRILRFFFAR